MFTKNPITRAIIHGAVPLTISYQDVADQVTVAKMLSAVQPDLDPSFVKEATKTLMAQGGVRMPTQKAIDRYKSNNHSPGETNASQ